MGTLGAKLRSVLIAASEVPIDGAGAGAGGGLITFAGGLKFENEVQNLLAQLGCSYLLQKLT